MQEYLQEIFNIFQRRKLAVFIVFACLKNTPFFNPFSSQLGSLFSHNQRSFFLVGEVVDGYAKLWLWPSLGSSCFTRGSRGTGSSFMSMSLFVLSLSILSHQRRNDSQCKAWAIDEHITSQCIAGKIVLKKIPSPCNSWECDEPQRGRPKRGKSNWSTTLSRSLLISACCDVLGVLHGFSTGTIEAFSFELWIPLGLASWRCFIGCMALSLPVYWAKLGVWNFMARVVWRKCKVEWKSLQKAFDDFVAPPLWVCTLRPFNRYALLRSWALGLWGEFDVNDEANKLTYQKLVQALPLKASGSKKKLLALLGRTRFLLDHKFSFWGFEGDIKRWKLALGSAGVKSLQWTHHRSVWNHHLALLLEA